MYTKEEQETAARKFSYHVHTYSKAERWNKISDMKEQLRIIFSKIGGVGQPVLEGVE